MELDKDARRSLIRRVLGLLSGVIFSFVIVKILLFTNNLKLMELVLMFNLSSLQPTLVWILGKHKKIADNLVHTGIFSILLFFLINAIISYEIVILEKHHIMLFSLRGILKSAVAVISGINFLGISLYLIIIEIKSEKAGLLR